MTTPTVEGVHPLAFATAEDVAEHPPPVIDEYNARRLNAAFGHLGPEQLEAHDTPPTVKAAA